jgi:hypothetical protein
MAGEHVRKRVGHDFRPTTIMKNHMEKQFKIISTFLTIYGIIVFTLLLIEAIVFAAWIARM